MMKEGFKQPPTFAHLKEGRQWVRQSIHDLPSSSSSPSSQGHEPQIYPTHANSFQPNRSDRHRSDQIRSGQQQYSRGRGSYRTPDNAGHQGYPNTVMTVHQPVPPEHYYRQRQHHPSLQDQVHYQNQKLHQLTMQIQNMHHSATPTRAPSATTQPAQASAEEGNLLMWTPTF